MATGTMRRIARRGILAGVMSTTAAGSLALAAESTGEMTAAAGSGALPAPAVLEASGTRIGTVSIRNGSIFDLADPEENRMLFRLANRAHVTTRPEVIERQLLFHPGDMFALQAIEESERILRANRYIQDVSIEPVRRDGGVVDVEVRTSDTWTLMPKLSLSRSGGKNDTSLGLREMNLLGTGIAVEAMYKSDVDRDYRTLRVIDRNLGHSWYGLTGVYENNSDGHTLLLELEKPFYSLQSRDLKGFSLLDQDEVDYFYDAGEIAGAYRSRSRRLELRDGWSHGLDNGWVKRYVVGVAFDEHRFSETPGMLPAAAALPGNRKLVYPFVEFELLQDEFEEASNLDQINRTEDVFLGARLSARLGLATRTFGADRDAWLVNLAASTGVGSTTDRALMLSTELDGRIDQGELRNLALTAGATYYRRQSDHRLLYATLEGRYGRNLDLDNYFLVGGDSGLRGYPLRFQGGDRLALLTVEQRYFTDWYPWRLFRVGGAVFFDVGRSWGRSPVTRTVDGVLKDVGFGLRIGNTRSGLGRMTHIDVAFPLDGGGSISDLQFLISTKKSF